MNTILNHDFSISVLVNEKNYNECTIVLSNYKRVSINSTNCKVLYFSKEIRIETCVVHENVFEKVKRKKRKKEHAFEECDECKKSLRN